jgi:DnaJ-domain-containing protein 1
VTQDQFGDNLPLRFTKRLAAIPTYYEQLDLPSSATTDQVRRAYRLKSKLYHPDTTVLHPDVATQKFRELKEAYAVLNNPAHRAAYDMGQTVAPPSIENSVSNQESGLQDRRFRTTASAYLDPKERPLSPGEVFAVFLLGVTFVVCLVLAIILGVARGEMVLRADAPAVVSLPNARSAAARQALQNQPFSKKPQSKASVKLQPNPVHRKSTAAVKG